MRIPAGSVLIFPRYKNVLEFYELLVSALEELGINDLGIMIEPSYVLANRYNVNDSTWIAIPPLAVIIPEKTEIIKDQIIQNICGNVGYCFITRRDSWGEIEFIRIYNLSKLINYFNKPYSEHISKKDHEIYDFAGIKIKFNYLDSELHDHEFIVISAIEKTNASGFVSRRSFLDRKYEKTINKALEEYIDSIPIAFYTSDEECLPAVIVQNRGAIIIDVYLYEKYRAELFATALLTLLQLIH